MEKVLKKKKNENIIEGFKSYFKIGFKISREEEQFYGIPLLMLIFCFTFYMPIVIIVTKISQINKEKINKYFFIKIFGSLGAMIAGGFLFNYYHHNREYVKHKKKIRVRPDDESMIILFGFIPLTIFAIAFFGLGIAFLMEVINKIKGDGLSNIWIYIYMFLAFIGITVIPVSYILFFRYYHNHRVYIRRDDNNNDNEEQTK